MAIIRALPPEPDDVLAGIVEADEAHQRESRKGSREWVRHRRDPKKPSRATAPALAGLQASPRVGDSAAGRLARLGTKSSFRVSYAGPVDVECIINAGGAHGSSRLSGLAVRD